MDIRELKDLLKNSTSVLILDDGEPSYVILDYQVYRNLVQAREQEIVVKNHTSHENPGFEKVPTPESHQNSQLQHPDEVGAPPKTSGLSTQEVEALERLNREIQALKDQIEQDEKQGGFQENQ